MKHDWKEYTPYDDPVDQRTTFPWTAGVIVTSDPPGERKYWKCDRCGSRMKTSALGKMPTRVDIPIDGSIAVWPQREIIGWETPEQGARSCKVHEDCDVALVAEIMAS